jgi:hypothetical protein
VGATPTYGLAFAEMLKEDTEDLPFYQKPLQVRLSGAGVMQKEPQVEKSFLLTESLRVYPTGAAEER